MKETKLVILKDYSLLKSTLVKHQKCCAHMNLCDAMIEKIKKNHSMSKRIRPKKLTPTFPQLPC